MLGVAVQNALATFLLAPCGRRLVLDQSAAPEPAVDVLLDGQRLAVDVNPPNGETEYFYEGGLPYDRTANFERLFTLRTSLRSPRNFGNARFRRFANFDFLTPKKKNWKKFRMFFVVFHNFRSILEELGFF